VRTTAGDAFVVTETLANSRQDGVPVSTARVRPTPPATRPGRIAGRRPLPATGRLTLPHATALYIGAVLGTGVITLPALAARVAGPASLLAWLGLVAASAPLAATFAALAARYPDSGGVSTYVRHAFGDRAAAVVGWWFYLTVPVGAPAAALFGGGYVGTALGGGRTTVLWSAGMMMAAVTVANVFGVRVSGRLALGLSGLLALILLVAATTSLPHGHLGNLAPFAPYGWGAVGTAAVLLVWNFSGWEAVTHLAAEFRRPDRDLPRATGAAVAAVGALYLLVAVAVILVLGPDGGGTAPLSGLLAVGVGAPGRALSAAVAVALTLGTMNAYFAGTAKLGAALGRDGAFPGWLARGSQAGQVPRRSLAVVAGLSAVVFSAAAATGSGPRVLVLLTAGAFVAVYLLGTASATRLLPRRSRGWWMASLAAVFCALLVVASGRYLAWPGFLGIACLVYTEWRRRRHHTR
jgi:amino acid efflux transporter